MGVTFVKGLTFRYIAVLIGLASLAVASNLVFKQFIDKQKTDAAEINIAGRQRMLSQRIMLLGLELDRLKESRERAWIRQEYTATIDKMARSHHALVSGNKVWGFSPPSETIKAMYFGEKFNVNARVEAYIKDAKALLTLHPPGANPRKDDHNHQSAFNNLGGTGFLTLLDDVVAQYQRESEKKLVALSHLEDSALAATLLLLFLSAVGVFAPAIKRLKAHIAQLEETQISLQKSNARFRDFTDTASDWVWEMDEELRFTRVSERFFDLFHIEKESLIGHTRWERLDPTVVDTDSDHWTAHRQDLENRKPFENFQYDVKDKEGYTHHIDINGKPIYDSDGRFLGYRGTGKDVTRSVKTEAKLRVSEHSLDEAQRLSRIGSWNWDLITNEVTWSDEMCRIFNLKKGTFELSLKTILNLISPTDKELVKEEFRKSLKTPGYSDALEIEFFPSSNSPRVGNLLMKSEFSKKGKPINLMGSVQDVTDRKKVEADLRKAIVTAEKANKAKSEFLSSMSHELRTPLNAILGFGQMLQMDSDEFLSEEQQTCIEQIVGGGRLLKELIDDILDLSKIEAGSISLSLDNVIVDSLISDCITLISGIAKRKNITIKTMGEADLTAKGDYTRLRQVIINLMSNAIKYNADNGTVWVQWESLGKSYVRLSVKDNGRGVALEKQNQLFEPFNRLGAESLEIEGTGIGLTITKRLVEAMKGKVGFISEKGKGSTFWVDIPLSFSSEHEATASEIRDMAAEVVSHDPIGKILYVEDNPANLQLMTMMIGRMAGVKLICAETAEAGIELAKQLRPDLVLMDINLPGMDGVSALKVLKEMDETKNIPVVAVSAAVMKTDIEKGMEAGFRAYLSKPINVKQVLATLDDVLGDSATHRQKGGTKAPPKLS
ncbi:MAG: ATP-binding protein [Rhodospirillales bacterium]|nr:ATP-binding protein [Rhodospirillales bacterium]